jgi:DHA2 family multidrug resistance protein
LAGSSDLPEQGIIREQPRRLAYSDAFYLMGAALLLALVTSLAMRKSGGGGAGAH